METSLGVMLGILMIELGGLLVLTAKGNQVLERILHKFDKTNGGSDPHQGTHVLTNFCVWKWEGKWRLIENRCQPGFEPGDPPHRAGAMPNEIVRKPAVRKP
jgi:hypothetical protein